MSDTTLPLLTRFWFSWLCLLRVLFDGGFARRVWDQRAAPALPAAEPGDADDDADDDADEDEPEGVPSSSGADRKAALLADEALRRAAPLQLLALLQREGRLIDFLEQDIAGFGDADIGAAARVVHQGCRKALREHAEISPVRDEDEDSRVQVEDGFDPSEIKLTGQVTGEPPFKGVLRHRGWRVRDLTLPAALEGRDFEVVAPAEVEL